MYVRIKVMETISEFLDSKKPHIIGKILHADRCGRILKITLPPTKDIITVKAGDLEDARLKVLRDYIPILAHSTINYPGEPILAVFGKTSEEVDIYISQIVVEIDENASGQPQSNPELSNDTPPLSQNAPELQNSSRQDRLYNGATPFGRPFRFSSGNINAYFKNPDNVFESEFEIRSYSSSMLSAQRIYANINEEKIYLSCASQWPLHVRDSVASALKIPQKNVIIFPEPFHTNYNNLLILPSIFSAIAAFAARKTGMMVELQVDITTWRPHTKFIFQTQLDANNKPLAYRVRADIDFGAYPVFTEEICNNIMAGLIPDYKVNAFEININSLKSNNPPANFFGDAGFTAALTATENHFNTIIKKIGVFPSRWRLENLKADFAARRTVIETTSPEGMFQNVYDCINDTDFDRRFSIYNQNNESEQKSAILPYTRGIGMAAGQGIFGFSNKFQYLSQYSISLTLGEKDITVYLAFNTTRYLRRIYRSIIQKYFDINTDRIIFEDINNAHIQDSGPNVLSRASSMIVFMLEKACAQLKKKQQQGYSLPITETSFSTGFEDSEYFISCCSACISVDMHMDTVKIIPVIDKVTVRVKTGKIFDVSGFQDTVKHTITRTVSEICPCSSNKADIDLKIRSNPHIFSGFSKPMIMALTSSALCTAISQALNQDIEAIPITEQDIVNLLKKSKNKDSAPAQ